MIFFPNFDFFLVFDFLCITIIYYHYFIYFNEFEICFAVGVYFNAAPPKPATPAYLRAAIDY